MQDFGLPEVFNSAKTKTSCDSKATKENILGVGEIGVGHLKLGSGKAEAGRTLSSRPTWSTLRGLVHPKLRSQALSQKVK